MKLSAVLIARNEEAMIGRCLSSLQGFDEIVVLDTGSTDRTVEIAADAGCFVHTDFAWCDDFAAARNAATVKATGDWILSVDCDWELLTPAEGIRAECERLQSIGYRAGLCKAIHGPGNEHWLTVLWARGAGEWVGPVHEYFNAHAHKTGVAFRIGQSPAKLRDPLRNLRILRKADLTVPRNQFYLGRELYEKGRFEESIAWLGVYLKNGQFLAEVAEAHLTIARCHWQSGQGDKARSACLKAITCNPDWAEALRFMAVLHGEPWKSKWSRLASAATNEDVLFLRAA